MLRSGHREWPPAPEYRRDDHAGGRAFAGGGREQADYGLAENRVVFTHDPDFLRLQAAGRPHAGIVYRSKDTLGLGETIKRLVLIWEIYEPQEMVNRVEFL
jgi:hypothetical protein